MGCRFGFRLRFQTFPSEALGACALSLPAHAYVTPKLLQFSVGLCYHNRKEEAGRSLPASSSRIDSVGYFGDTGSTPRFVVPYQERGGWT